MKSMIIISNRKKLTLRQKILTALFKSDVREWVQRDSVIRFLEDEHAGFVFLNVKGIEEKNTLDETIKTSDPDKWFRIIVLEKFAPGEFFKSLLPVKAAAFLWNKTVKNSN